MYHIYTHIERGRERESHANAYDVCTCLICNVLFVPLTEINETPIRLHFIEMCNLLVPKLCPVNFGLREDASVMVTHADTMCEVPQVVLP